MSLYNSFIGIDIGKFNFVVAAFGSKETKEYKNDDTGIGSFLKDRRKDLSNGLVILETTGGYEMRLLLTLCGKGYKVHRANTRKVKSFIKSYGNIAKTDNLDAKALSLYGYERGDKLELFNPASSKQYDLFELAQRRKELKQIRAAEKNRLKAPKTCLINESCLDLIKHLDDQIKTMDREIAAIIKSDETLLAKLKILQTIPGIGNITAEDLLVLMPELGTMTNKQAASLSGTAPRSNDSGLKMGYRKTGYGRTGIKPILFISAMAASKSNTHMRDFYKRLVESGKKKMVAMTALMRKIIVIANAKLRDLTAQTVACAV